MKLNQLECFLVVAETLHFGKAAERLYMTPQALGAQIRQLESELGCQLFIRTTRSVKLSAAGEAFAKKMRDGLADLDNAVTLAKKYAEGTSGRIDLAYNSWTLPVLAKALSAAQGTHPNDIEFHLHDVSNEDIDQMAMDLRDGVLDAVAVVEGKYTSGFRSILGDFNRLLLAEDHATIAMPRSWNVTQSDSIAVAELKDLPWVLLSGNTNYNRFLEETCLEEGFSPRITQQADSHLALLGLVASGAGIMPALASSSDFWPNTVAYIPIRGNHFDFNIWLLWSEENGNPALKQLVDALKDAPQPAAHAEAT